jgi:2-polyprenyl-3-methyl-5-hydroxy-6-metoxy-1,4-benzoquinol methylase
MLDTSCPICHSPLNLLEDNYPGYQEPNLYSICKCENCDTSVALPLSVDEFLYDTIYKQAENMPGYYRYFDYAEKVLDRENPIDYLSANEEMYWGVKKCLDQVKNETNNNIENVLEVGSGLGYLTYSIAKMGLHIKGIDIAEIAVSKAIKKYGDLFMCQDIYNLSEVENDKYDVIIMTEVIEHIPDPISFITKLVKLLKVGGTLFMTTPNKSFFDSQAIWETDAPPVHLWWFSRKSVEFIAKKVGCNHEFITMSDYSKDPDVIDLLKQKMPIPRTPRNHILTSDGNLFGGNSLRVKIAILLSKYGMIIVARRIKNNLLSLLQKTNKQVITEERIISVKFIKSVSLN